MGNNNTIPIGTVIDLGEYFESTSRRQFLRTLGGLAAGSVGLSTLITRAAGASPEGEPLVQTVGSNGEPRRVKVVSGRRHSVLKRYENLKMDKLARRYPGLQSVSVVSSDRDRSGLAFEMIFDGNEVSTAEAEEHTPPKLKGVPTVTTVEVTENVPESLEGGSTIDYQSGTATGVFYNSNNEAMLLTAEHVAGSTVSYNGQTVGDLHQADETTDTASYILRDGVNYDALGMKSPLTDVTEFWTFSGITDRMSMDPVPVELYGRSSDHVEDRVINTIRSRWYNDISWDYVVEMDNYYTDEGDSGGPWVHDGALVAQHVGARDPLGGSKFSAGTAAVECLSAVGVYL